MTLCRLGHFYLVLSLEASIWLGGIVPFLTQFLVIKLFIRRAGNEDVHKTLDEFEFV